MVPQGERGKGKELRHAEATLKMPALNYVITQIEEHARTLGFKQAKIVAPETLYFYKGPRIVQMKFTNKEAKVLEEKIRAKLAEEEKKAKQAHSKHALRSLAVSAHSLCAQIITRAQEEKARKLMKRLYSAIAKAMGYKREGDFYVKDL